MALTDLIPWGRNRSLTPQFSDERDPLLALHREMNRLFDDFSRGLAPPATNNAGVWSGAWPRVEVSENESEIKVAAELPGLEEKDVALSLHEGVLTISGEKTQQSDGPVYSEHWHGRFQRSIQVGPAVDADKVSASFRNGVLWVTLAKRPEAQAQVKRIPISVG